VFGASPPDERRRRGGGAAGARAGSDDRELVAADSRQPVAAAPDLLDGLPHRAQLSIPGGMAVEVVDALESSKSNNTSAAPSAWSHDTP
jgi:hypothetical protein